MLRTAIRFLIAIRFVIYFIGAALALIVAGFLIYRLVTSVQNQLCVASVLNSTKNKLVFEKYQPETDNAIYIMTTNGGWECRLSGDNVSDFSPIWSPDGKYIAFNSWDYQPERNLSEILVMNSDGTNRRLIIRGDQRSYYRGLTWSPDSKSIAFSKISDVDKSSKIYISRIEGADPPRLVTDSGFDDSSPAWSPDGKRIAFGMSKDTSSLWDIYLVDVDGSNEQRLTHTVGTGPAWSPDGRQIAFTGSYNKGLDLFIMNADGTNLHRLLADTPTADRGGAAWSPDGQQIAFSEGGIYVVNIDGSGLQPLTKFDDYHVDGSPSWDGLVASQK